MLIARGELKDYLPLHATRADLYRRMGKNDEAREAYLRALQLAKQEPQRRINELLN